MRVLDESRSRPAQPVPRTAALHRPLASYYLVLASTGLLLALGLGGIVLTARRRTAAKKIAE